jgi:translation initiation factor eIF-2B subunit epsilon
MGKPPPTSSSSNDPSDNKTEQKLQAVLLADAFSNAFHPITLEPYRDHRGDVAAGGGGGVVPAGRGNERPLVLCPLNNVPVLHHSIDFLQGNGVEELFVLCCASSGSADAVESYIRANAHANASGTTTNGNNNCKSGGRPTRCENDVAAEGGGRKIAWSSKLSITVMRFTDCTNAGE